MPPEKDVLGPVLKGDRVTLRPPQEEDLPLFCEWFSRPEVTRTLLTRFPPSLEAEREWFARTTASRNDVVWVIAAADRAVGISGIHQIEWINRTAITGTLIGDPADWGHGFGSEATRLRTGFAFDELNLERLETSSLAHNVGMHRALEKVGYTRIGTRRHFHYSRGQWYDAVMFELLREDYAAKSGT
ncbi:MAG TPA: GNAT family protein [Chloroflexota bacterium]|nr:GNAT family protein [Chloroflexota bacterium]